MRFLVVLPECGFTSSSANVFAKNLLSELSHQHHIDVIGFKLPADYLHSLSREGAAIKTWMELVSPSVIKRAPKLNSSTGSSQNKEKKLILDKIKNFFKSIIPDFYALGILGIQNIDRIKLDADYDYIISMSDPKSAHFLALYLKYKFKSLRKTKHIQMWGDPWYFDITRSTNFCTKVLETFLLNNADYIFYRSKATVRKQQAVFKKSAKKMHMIDRGFLGNDLVPSTISLKKTAFNFLYLGDYHPHVRKLEPFCSAASQAGHHVQLIGTTSPECQKQLGQLTNICLRPRLPPADLPQIIDSSDCLVAVLNTKGTQIPGKLYDLIPIQKPVILLLDGDIELADIPALSRFIVIQNTAKDLQSFFSDLNELDSKIDTSLNDYAIHRVVNNFISTLK